ncbi:ExeM/NucH family extracellular endonuclease [Serinicoccus kebangsaanensis]|uniref:ExeM/NucH family extracellular endonuclease n=1 Tax=Serinicoccus kebangsaanensis TaxID=2602069 RepID=UPI00124DB5AA|nr:ExeM/NucH family extracellular endonuclease [Serinicoccus kebangsaanensis]
MQNHLRRAVAAASTTALAVTGLVALAPSSLAAGPGLVINEVYGGGGNSGADYTHDFVELFNSTEDPIDLDGYAVSYYSSSGNLGNRCELSGSVEPGTHFLVQQSAGSGGSTPLPDPDAECGASMSGSNGIVELTLDDEVADLVGYGSAVRFEGSAAAPGLSNTTSASRADAADTDDNAADFTAGDPSPVSSGGGGTDPDPEPDPDPVEASIAEIQGPGDTSPLVDQPVITTGVVTAAYPTGNFNGIYIQTPGTGGVPKTAEDASDGIFVYSSWAAANVEVGACVDVEGTVIEYDGLTEISESPWVEVVEGGCDPVVPTDLDVVPATDADKESYEGMLVQPTGTWTITNNYLLNRFGEIGLTPGTEPLYQATDVVLPGAEAEAYEAANLARLLTLDDGSSLDYLNNATAQDSPLPYLSAQEPHRTGSQVTFAQPVILDERFGWKLQPTAQVVGSDSAADPLVSEDDREADVPEVGGNIQIGAFNVLNYFSDLGQDEAGCDYYADRDGNPVATDFCEVRGAWTEAAFADQQAKLVTAINGTDAEVLALMEIENSAGLSYIDHPRDKALSDLVDALNAAAGEERWAYAPSPTALPPNEDVIRTAFIYDPGAVQLLGPSQIQLDDAFANARYPLAQKFKAKKTGKPFVAISNHFKSKGSGEDDGTGQGLANPSRVAQSQALTGWVDEMFGDEAVFLMGDFNAYSREDPVRLIEDEGYTNLARSFEPDSATYQFSGRLGSLDHVFANDKAERLVTGAAVWDINGDESIAFQYSRRNYNVVDFHSDDQFASSDHDPVVVGLQTGKDKKNHDKPKKPKKPKKG